MQVREELSATRNLNGDMYVPVRPEAFSFDFKSKIYDVTEAGSWLKSSRLIENDRILRAATPESSVKSPTALQKLPDKAQTVSSV